MAWSSYALGLGFLGIVVILWVTTGVITQSIFVDLNLDAPFFLTYCNNLIFVGYLVPDLWRRKTETQYTEIGEVDDWRSRVRLASVFCPVWFAMSYLYNASLAHTSVASNTIMSSTSSFFTFLLGIAILRQSFSYVSLMGVICT